MPDTRIYTNYKIGNFICCGWCGGTNNIRNISYDLSEFGSKEPPVKTEDHICVECIEIHEILKEPKIEKES